MTFGAIIEGFEQISHLMTRCKILENLYLRPFQQSSATEQSREAIVKLYLSFLGYLHKARQYLGKSTAKQIMLVLDGNGFSTSKQL